MISANIKTCKITRNKRTGGCILQRFARVPFQNLKLGMFFLFNVGWYFIQLDITG